MLNWMKWVAGNMLSNLGRIGCSWNSDFKK